jgi:hypothetical protein
MEFEINSQDILGVSDLLAIAREKNVENHSLSEEEDFVPEKITEVIESSTKILDMGEVDETKSSMISEVIEVKSPELSVVDEANSSKMPVVVEAKSPEMPAPKGVMKKQEVDFITVSSSLSSPSEDDSEEEVPEMPVVDKAKSPKLSVVDKANSSKMPVVFEAKSQEVPAPKGVMKKRKVDFTVSFSSSSSESEDDSEEVNHILSSLHKRKCNFV